MLKVLIAEDDLMIADSAEEILVENEYQVCGIARTVMRSPRNHPTYDPGTRRSRELNLAMHQVRQHPSGPGPGPSDDTKLPDGFPVISTRRRRRGNERKTDPAAVARF
jgi:hypothetical protein